MFLYIIVGLAVLASFIADRGKTLGAAAICRVPMAIFEASFLGIKFTAIRWLVSLPLVVITSVLLGNYLTRRNYKIMAGK